MAESFNHHIRSEMASRTPKPMSSDANIQRWAAISDDGTAKSLRIMDFLAHRIG
jgi:hypothetical protein